MENGIKITPSNCASFNNALHAQFHNQMYNLIDQWPVELSVINVSDELMSEWHKLIATEIDINREVQASSDTAKLAESDRQRDEIITYLFATIRAAKRSPITKQKEAAIRLALITDKYKGLQKEGFDEETIHVDGLVVDFTKAQSQNDLTQLGVYEVVHTLKQVNEEFRSLRAQRTANRAETKLPAAKEIRLQGDAVYARICQLIEVSYLLCNVSANKDEIGKLADLMNQQIAEIKTAHKQSQSNTSSTPAGRRPRRTKEDKVEE